MDLRISTSSILSNSVVVFRSLQTIISDLLEPRVYNLSPDYLNCWNHIFRRLETIFWNITILRSHPNSISFVATSNFDVITPVYLFAEPLYFHIFITVSLNCCNLEFRCRQSVPSHLLETFVSWFATQSTSSVGNSYFDDIQLFTHFLEPHVSKWPNWSVLIDEIAYFEALQSINLKCYKLVILADLLQYNDSTLSTSFISILTTYFVVHNLVYLIYWDLIILFNQPSDS